MRGMLPTKPAVLAELQLVRRVLLILGGRVIAPLALGTSQGDNVPHDVIL
jgi:hypothetical protein